MERTLCSSVCRIYASGISQRSASIEHGFELPTFARGYQNLAADVMKFWQSIEERSLLSPRNYALKLGSLGVGRSGR